MKLIYILLIMFCGLNAFANEVKIEINPPRPVAGESFQAFFRIFTDLDSEPVINFGSYNLEVVGKSNQGISTRTIYANGKLTVTREITMVYDLVAAKPGTANLRDINVQLGDKIIRHPPLSLTILKEPEVLADVFVMVDVAKKTLYIGEGIVARYYLYSKVPVSNLDIKKYPKLNNFLKRFLQEPERSERVAVDGQVYLRTQIYAAKLYPEKVGELKIDGLQLSATYSSSRAGDPFGAFGLGRDFKTRTINSETVKINVLPLPEPVPQHFTGLVGPHEFQLQFGQTKLIVNQPLEVKLTVSGIGALENLEAPELIKHQGLEEFESNGDLKISDADRATKVFDYTFLAKENLKLPPKEIVVSYLDTSSGSYVPTKLNIPEIIVAGAQLAQNNKPETLEESRQGSMPSLTKPQMIKELAGPVLLEEWQWKKWLPFFNLSLGALAILISLGWMIRENKITIFKINSDVPSNLKKNEFKLNEFILWITPLIKKTGKSPLAIIKESPLSEDSKRYFIELLTANDHQEYSSRKSRMDYKYQATYFKELARYIGSFRNEDSSPPA